jgi:hypothetical protein
VERATDSSVREELKRLRLTRQANPRAPLHILHHPDPDARSSHATTMNWDTIP